MTGDPLDRIRQALDAICQDSLETTLARTLENREWSEKQAVSSLFLIVADGLDALGEVARAARDRRAHEHNMPVLLDDQTYESWAREDRSLGAAEDAALARLDGPR